MSMDNIKAPVSLTRQDIVKKELARKTSSSQTSMPVEPALPLQKVDGVKVVGEEIPEEEVKMATEKQIQKAVEHLNKSVNNRTKCAFSYHEGTKMVSIKIIDEDTDEVIKEIPPEKSLEMLQKMWELSGIFVDEKR